MDVELDMITMKQGEYSVIKCSKNYKLTKYLLLSPNIPACPWAEWL